jgi:hypothetical protein
VNPGVDASVIAALDAGATSDARAVTPGLPEVFPDRPPAPPVMAAVAPEALVAYWPLDEGEGSYVWDQTGNGNDGVMLLGATWRMAGFPAAAFANPAEMQLDGIDDLAEFFGRTVPDIDKPKSISLWARYDYPVDALRAQALMVLLNRTRSAGLRLELRDGRLAATSYFYNEIVGMPAPPLGWHHVVYTYDGNTHALYLDAGTPVTSMVAAEAGSVLPPDGRTRLGRSSSTVDDAFRGFLDDVRVYKRALTAAEVKSLYLGTR